MTVVWTSRLAAFVAAATLMPSGVLAETAGFFASVQGAGGLAFGSTSTTNGGAPGFDGVARDLRLGNVAGASGEIGYRFDNQFGLSLGYTHVSGSAGWEADFQLVPVTSAYQGTASSDALMARVYYEMPIASATAIELKGGLGVSFNTLSGIVETEVPGGAFLAVLGDRTVASPAAEIGLGLTHEITSSAAFSVGGTLAYVGSFSTGDTRRGNLGTTAINPYTIDSVWQARINAKLTFAF